MGWAAATPGGRNGQIIRVTTLNADGPGSLLEALGTKGARIVVFEVGGVIDLGKRDVRITEPFLTISGQTAPSPGITLIRGKSVAIVTHDVIVQHLRIRPGETVVKREVTSRPSALAARSRAGFTRPCTLAKDGMLDSAGGA